MDELERLRLENELLRHDLENAVRGFAHASSARSKAELENQRLRRLVQRSAGGATAVDLLTATQQKAERLAARVAELHREKGNLVRAAQVAVDLWRREPTGDETRQVVEGLGRALRS